MSRQAKRDLLCVKIENGFFAYVNSFISPESEYTIYDVTPTIKALFLRFTKVTSPKKIETLSNVIIFDVAFIQLLF